MGTYNSGVLAYADELAKDRLVILDRQCLSSYVYQDVFRPAGRENHPGMYTQHKQYCPNSTIIFCLPEFGFWKKNFLNMCASREELYGADKIDQMVQIYERYEEMAYGITEDQKPTTYPDKLLMKHIDEGGIDSTVYDFTKVSDRAAWVQGFLMQHQSNQ